MKPSFKESKKKDKESTKRAATITGSAMMSMLPILDITRYGLAHGAAKNLAGVAGGLVGSDLGSRADAALDTNFLGVTGGLPSRCVFLSLIPELLQVMDDAKLLLIIFTVIALALISKS